MGDSEQQPGFWESVKEGAWDGDFSDNDSWTKTITQVLVGFVPYAGQVADARDTIKAAKDVWAGKDGAWTSLGLAGIGWIPGLGDAIKGGVRVSRKGVKAAVEIGGKTADEIAAALRSARRVEGSVKKFPIPDGVRKEFDDVFAKREAARARRDVLEAKAKNGTITDAEKTELSGKRYEVNESSRQLGEKAGDAFIARDFPGAEKLYPPAGAGSRSGDFDAVWKAKDPATGQDVFIVVEAKGGSAGLGSRDIGGGIRADQGSAEYFDSIVREMKKSGASVADDLEMARLSDSVRYFETRAEIGTKAGSDVLKDIKVGEFDLKPPK
jgi:hypothetical protein